MNNNTKAALLAASLIAMALAPLAMAETATGPGSVTVRGVASLGAAVCQNIDDDDVPDPLPAPGDFSCDPQPGFLGSGGGAFFDVSSLSTANYGYIAKIDIEYDDGSGAAIGGYSASGCTDRDDDDSCTNVSATVDDWGEGYTGDEFLTFDLCIRQDTVAAGAGFDDLVVFIEGYAEEDQTGFTGGASTSPNVSAGQFDVTLTITGTVANDTDCAVYNENHGDLA